MVFIEDIIVDNRHEKRFMLDYIYSDLYVKLSDGAIKAISKAQDLDGLVGVSFGFDTYMVTYNKYEQYLYNLYYNGEVYVSGCDVYNGVVVKRGFHNLLDAFKLGIIIFDNMSERFNLALSKCLMLG